MTRPTEVIIDGVKYIPELPKVRGNRVGTLGETLRARRVALGLTIKTACERIGMGRSALWAIEQDYANPNLRTFVRIGRAYEIPLEEMASYLL